MDCKNVISLLILIFFCGEAIGQRQLIVLKDEQVLARYQKGDILKFARPQDKEILVQRILDLNDTLVMMNFDSVTYYRIDRLDIKGKQRNKFPVRMGYTLLLAGSLLPLIDVFNETVIQDESASLNKSILFTSGVMIGTGAALILIKKPYFKPGRRNRLMIIDQRSPFYKEKPVDEGYLSPLIPKN
jgi:hypothetical protein